MKKKKSMRNNERLKREGSRPMAWLLFMPEEKKKGLGMSTSEGRSVGRGKRYAKKKESPSSDEMHALGHQHEWDSGPCWGRWQRGGGGFLSVGILRLP